MIEFQLWAIISLQRKHWSVRLMAELADFTVIKTVRWMEMHESRLFLECVGGCSCCCYPNNIAQFYPEMIVSRAGHLVYETLANICWRTNELEHRINVKQVEQGWNGSAMKCLYWKTFFYIVLRFEKDIRMDFFNFLNFTTKYLFQKIFFSVKLKILPPFS